MALIPLNTSEDNSNSDKELPWLNVYAKGKKVDDEEYDVCSISEYDSGLMVCTKTFKAYVHEGTRTHTQLLEALNVFVEMRTATGAMIGKVGPGKKINLFVDNERLNHYWHKTENKYVQVFLTDHSHHDEDTSNPFLAGMGVLPVHAGAQVEGVEGEPETRRAALRRGKKGGKVT